MMSFFLIALLATPAALASPTRRAIDNTQAYGTNPIFVASAALLGNQVPDNSCSHRDLGFTGPIGENWYAVYGDTLWCAQGQTNPADDDQNQFHGLVRDSVSLVGNDPLKVQDLFLNSDSPVPHQKQFVPYNTAWGENSTWGFGGTSLCETDASAEEAAIFYLRNANSQGLKGAGVGKVKVTNGTPQVVERMGDNGFWWDSTTNPRYGDSVAYSDTKSDYIYAIGGAPTSITDPTGSLYQYMVRVQKSSAFDLSSYEYWHGRQQGWSSSPLSTFSSETAVLWGTGQGQIVWNEHYNCYIYVHMTIDGDQVLLRSATKPEGPWGPDVTAYSVDLGDNNAYAAVAYPYLDTSGKTLTVSYTHMPNRIEVVKITFA